MWKRRVSRKRSGLNTPSNMFAETTSDGSHGQLNSLSLFRKQTPNCTLHPAKLQLGAKRVKSHWSLKCGWYGRSQGQLSGVRHPAALGGTLGLQFW